MLDVSWINPGFAPEFAPEFADYIHNLKAEPSIR
jgi:hypothetical protein